VARAPLALERLSVTDEGKLRCALKHPYSNGTTHFLSEPLDLLARLVPGKTRKKYTHEPDPSDQPIRPSQQQPSDAIRLTSAQRLERAFEFDVRY
jgi:hypothetical protein